MIVVTEVAKTYPSLASSIARGVAEGAPRLAPTITATLAPAITLGVYDNAQTMTDKPLAYEEVFVDQTSATGWVGTNKQSVHDFATAAWAKGRTPIISIEPSSGDPLDEIVSGKRDKELANMCSQLAHTEDLPLSALATNRKSQDTPGEGNRRRNISQRTAT